MGNMDVRVNERAADKILDVFSDGRITSGDLMMVAMYTVSKARTRGIVERVLEFAEHVKYEIDRQEKINNEADSLF
jgi:hypothetical protein